MSQGLVVCTVTFLLRDNQVLLVRGKKRMNKGLWNGYGGKQDVGESIRTTACRESFEEGGVTIQESALAYMGCIDFLWPQEGADVGVAGVKVVRCYMFTAKEWEGKPTETSESGCPTWYAFDAIPYEAMFPGERYWLPQLLNGAYVTGSVAYKKDTEIAVTDHAVRVVSQDALPPLD